MKWDTDMAKILSSLQSQPVVPPMHRIHKYPLVVQSDQFIKLPIDHVRLEFEMQADYRDQLIPTLWALVPLEDPLETFKIICLNTGSVISNEALGRYHHMGTVQEQSYVWHFFISKEPIQ